MQVLHEYSAQQGENHDHIRDHRILDGQMHKYPDVSQTH